MKAIQRCMGGVILLLVLAQPSAHAQTASTGSLQDQMSAEQFRAAGLHKLSGAELAALTAWLQREVDQNSALAVAGAREQTLEEGRQDVIVKNRGFLSFGSSEPITAMLQGEFNGFQKGRTYTLDNGQIWEQTDTSSLHGVRRQNARIRITPGMMEVWYLQVEGLNTRAKVKRIK